MNRNRESKERANEMTTTAQESLNRMWRAANQFYQAATETECHAFIEFTGLLRE
jgi:hypothetical protein